MILYASIKGHHVVFYRQEKLILISTVHHYTINVILEARPWIYSNMSMSFL